METLEESRGTGILGVYSITFEDANEETEVQTECNRVVGKRVVKNHPCRPLPECRLQGKDFPPLPSIPIHVHILDERLVH
ncbi:hypothetical protein QR680_011148 [Steinernema hermaphroditum]|uniref:Uncharacterized protein n=1 Tax=Steinernema hermaphroditum TaxID=289476 RepID=A0AA39IRA0_9BILA|nr:hypothetical protein QR680_011148 [Steinernema hermaphroditum]